MSGISNNMCCLTKFTYILIEVTLVFQLSKTNVFTTSEIYKYKNVHNFGRYKTHNNK